MDKIPLQYITNLDNKYNTLILKIEENIKNFNTYIYNFVQQNYGKTSKNDNQTCTEETATNDETTTNEETTTNDSYDNTEENALVIFNNIEDLYRNIINKRGEESQPSEIPNDLSGNNLSGNDLSGNNIHIENDASGRNEEYIENDASGGNGENQPKTITIKQYEIPELVFPTKKKSLGNIIKNLLLNYIPIK